MIEERLRRGAGRRLLKMAATLAAANPEKGLTAGQVQKAVPAEVQAVRAAKGHQKV